MASCGCTSNSTPSYGSTFSSGCGTSPAAGPTCPTPRRVASPPVSPVKWNGAERLLQSPEGKPMATRCDGEVVVIDSPVDGVMMFNAETGNQYVGTPIIQFVPDVFACETAKTYGLPAYGAAPGCHADGEHPDRQLGFFRPQTSDTGLLFAHQKSCCAVSGDAGEMTPVEIVPGQAPSPAPFFLRYLTYVQTEGTTCDPQQMQWYWSSGQPSVNNDELVKYTELPAREWEISDNNTFGLGVWVAQSNGTWLLEKASNESFQAYIDSFLSKTQYLNPRVIVASQASPIPYDYSFVTDLRTMPNYDPKATEVQLYVQSSMSSPVPDGAVWSFEVKVNGVSKYKTSGGPTAASELSSSPIFAPIPDDKLLNVEYLKVIYFAGTQHPYNASTAEVFLEAFK